MPEFRCLPARKSPPFRTPAPGSLTAGAFPQPSGCAATASADWSRRLVAEHVLAAGRPDLAAVRHRGRGRARAPSPRCRASSGCRVDLIVEAAREAVALGIPAVALFPYTDPKLRSDDAREAFNPDNLVCRATRADQEGRARHRRDPRRGARPLHQPRPRRPAATATIVNDETIEALVAPGARAGGGRLRHHRAVRHDGRPHRRDPRARSRPRATATRRSCPTPPSTRSAFYGPFRDAVGSAGCSEGRQAHLPDGPGQLATKRCARSRSTSPRAPTW